MVSVKNEVKKPGPVFLEMARAAYGMGADYFYRVNDDTECLKPWAKAFATTLEVSRPFMNYHYPHSSSSSSSFSYCCY